VPAAAVIPAPIAYIKVVAVKKLVVGFLAWMHLVLAGVCDGDFPPPSRVGERTWHRIVLPGFQCASCHLFWDLSFFSVLNPPHGGR